MATKPARHGSAWTKTEEEEILRAVAKGLTYAAIAKRQQRTTGGIRARLTQIACRFVEGRMTLCEASTRTSIRIADIITALDKTLPHRIKRAAK
jgi:hypothetical protein